MPNWKKVIVSGSDASLNSLAVSSNITAQSFTGSLQGTSSYAVTASYALNGGGSAGAASYTFNQSTPSTTWTINHNLTSSYPAITVYDTSGYVIIPQNIQSTSPNQTILTFSYGATGYATAVASGASIGSGGSGNNATQSFSNLSTWTFNHGLGNQAVIVQTFDNSWNQIIPQNITLVDTTTATITFPTSESGYAVATLGGFGTTAPTASYVLNAVSASYARTSSMVPSYEGSWTAYTPVWTAASSNPVIGNGTIEGYYKVVGKTCFVRGNIAMGSSTTFGSGEWYVSMPFTASHADGILMTATLLDNSTAWYNAIVNGARAGFNYKSAIQYQVVGGTADSITPTTPFTWTTSDRFIWNGSYEIL